jgi:hypothetical protein
VSAALIVAIVAAAAAVAAAAGAVCLLRRAQSSMRTLEQELERGKAMFDAVVAREAEQRATDLEQTLSLARAESLTALLDEERRITEERRRDVAERERDASSRLAHSLTEAQRRVEEKVAGWSTDVEQLQESLAAELGRIGLRLGQLTTDAEGKLADEAERLQGVADEHRALIAKLREDFERSAQEVAKAAAADLELQASDRRRSLQEVSDRMQRRERDLHEQIEREFTEAVQRISSQVGDVEHRQLEQLRRVVSREATRYAEAAAQQMEATIRAAREEAAKRLGRELDLSVERFAREAEGVLAERVEHLADGAVQRVDARLRELARRVDELGART